MRIATSIALAACLLAAAGCGGKKSETDSKPFAAAIVEYCRVNSMGMKPDTFESIEIAGETAVVKVRMATADDLYGMKPLWTIRFRRKGDTWAVTGVDR